MCESLAYFLWYGGRKVHEELKSFWGWRRIKRQKKKDEEKEEFDEAKKEGHEPVVEKDHD